MESLFSCRALRCLVYLCIRVRPHRLKRIVERWNFELGHNRRPGMKCDERLKLWFKTRSRVHLLFIFDIYSAQGLFSLSVSQGECHGGLVLTLLTLLEFLTSALLRIA